MSLYIKKLIQEGEGQQLDFKYAINDSRKIARSIVAFANTDGGRLLIGVKDNGNISGIRTEEEFYMAEAAAQLYSRPEIFFDVKRWDIDGKTVLEIIIPKSRHAPHFAQHDDGKWLPYVRHNDQNIMANDVWVKAQEKKRRKKGLKIVHTQVQQLLIEYLEQNETITLQRFCQIAHITRQRAEAIMSDMIALHVIEMMFTDKDIFYRLQHTTHAEVHQK